MISNVDLGNKPSLTDEYWVEKITDNKIRYKYCVKRKKTGAYHNNGCELSMTYYEEVDQEVYEAFVIAIRQYTQQPIMVKIDQWVYVTLNNE